MTQRFKHKPVVHEQQVDMEIIRESFETLESDIEARCPAGRYKSLALTALEQAHMWANKSISHEWEKE